jgi:DNA replication protein DnaC
MVLGWVIFRNRSTGVLKEIHVPHEKDPFYLHMFTSLKRTRTPPLDVSHLQDKLVIARGEGIYKKVMKQYKKDGLLILDEWLLTPLKDSQAMDVLEIVETRHQNASTIFCTQFAPGGWHEKIGEGTLANAFLDRIVHDSYTIFIDGRVSMRERHGVKQTERD